MPATLSIQHSNHYSALYLANRLPLIDNVVIETDELLDGVELLAEFSPPLIHPLRWNPGQLKPGRHVEQGACSGYDPAALNSVVESTPGLAAVKLLRGEETLAESCFNFTWLPANVWAGSARYPELLASLVLPNDPVIDRMLSRGADILRAQGLSASWRGYQAEPNAIINQVHALWNALEELEFTYALPPRSWHEFGSGQKVRTPSQIMQGGCATCLDSTLCLAAAMAQAGFNPLVVLLPGHSFVGVMLKDASLVSPIETQPGTLRNLLELREVLLLETTLATSDGGASSLAGFDAARGSAENQLRTLRPGAEFLALDIVRIWATGVVPCMALAPEGSQEAPSLPDIPHWKRIQTQAVSPQQAFLPETSLEEREAAESLVSIRNRTRMEKWQLKLLDLSLRNNLLNSHIDRSQVSLLIPQVPALEDSLANGEVYTIRHLPETLGAQVTQCSSAESPEALRCALQPLAEDMFRKQQLLATARVGEMTEKILEKRIKALYDKARKNMEESGSNTLNLACGFLKWTPRGHGDRVLHAPILLLPVSLKRPSVRAGFKLCGTGEEPGINLTLLELLKTEFGLRIPALEGDLPHDEAGVDVAAIMQRVREAIRDFPGWEVVDLCTLGIFSFAKYLMWRDLKDRQEDLMTNPIVRHLAEGSGSPFPAEVNFPSPATLDTEADAKRIFTPLSADSSQLAAVLAAARGKNFVLIGPPGTGKSQTIANMIAHSLGQGKTVLFVAEKSAALSVVYRRLCRIGLGASCLELHSNKASKKEVLAQFAAAIEQTEKAAEQTRWELVVKKLLKLRRQLNALPEALHRRYPDGGCLYDDIGYLAAAEQYPLFPIAPGDPTEIPAEELDALRSQALELGRRFAPVQEILPGEAEVLCSTTFTSIWEQETAAALAHHIELVEGWRLAYSELMAGLMLDEETHRPHLQELECLLYVAHETHGQDVSSLLPAQATIQLACMRRELELAEEYRTARAKLSLDYPESALDEARLDQWLREWKIAHISNFFSRFFAQRRIRRELRYLALSRQQPDSLNDLTNLIAMRHARDELRASQTANPGLALCRRGVDMTADDLQRAEEWAHYLKPISHLTSLAQNWLTGHSPVAPGSPAVALLRRVQESGRAIRQHEETLTRLLGGAPPAFRHDAAAALSWSRRLLELRPHWRELVLWNKLAADARLNGHGLLVEALLAHKAEASQFRNACEWNLRCQRTVKAIDASETLSLFDRGAQEETIADFARQDATLLDTAASQLLARLTEKASEIHRREYHAELALLKKEITKQKRHLAPRALLSQTPHVSRLLKPCMLMSPLSVAQYLRPDSEPFDIVVFDEASQIPVWDAIGAIGRGSSAVIVGDPRQMPPTSFFSKGNNSDDEEDDDSPQDLESILDECKACEIPTMNLTWHYRSKAESLIAFSNHNYYEGKLTTFPAPVTQDKALSYHYAGGTYLKGSKRTNPEEARALVDHVLQVLRAPGFRYTELTSIGIVTFNTSQQALIEELLDEARAADESLEPFFSDANPEAIFVKNLENVQGDERGCIYFSTTFGPDEHGAISMNFGPLNNQGGERRLNVAITRARASMHVFSSLRPEDINLNRTKSRGAADLRNFLECASMGVAGYFSLVAPEREGAKRHELAGVIAAGLQKRGWVCKVNVGVSDFRIDIAVEQPQCAGSMLAGIMLDGPSYRAANTARDRDLLRPGVLQGLGWRLLHLWALDWWRNPESCLERLHEQLTELSHQGPPVMPELPSLVEEVVE